MRLETSINGFKNKFFQEYTLLYNSEKHYFIPIRKCAEKYSFYRLKKRINSCKTEFNFFITLTISPEEKKECTGYIVVPSQKIGRVPVVGIDRDGFQHVYQNEWIISYLPWQNTQEFNFVPLNMFKTEYLRRSLDLLRKRLSRRKTGTLQYMWRFERGSQGGREHYHLLIKSNLCRACLYFIFKEIWNYGFVDIKSIYNSATLKQYVSKYFTKHSKFNNLRVNSMKRRWSFSKNNEFGPIEKNENLEYYGNIYGSDIAKEYFLSNIKSFLEDYSIDFGIFLLHDIMSYNDSLSYISNTPYKRRYERLKKLVEKYGFKTIAKFININADS